MACYFDKFAQTYTAAHRLSAPCAKSIVKAILDRLGADDVSTMVDIGCGDAYLTSLLLTAGVGRQCFLVDISCAMLERAKQRLAPLETAHEVLAICGDAPAIPFRPQSVTVALMAFALHLLCEPALTLDVVAQALRSGGYFFLVTCDPEDLARHIYHRYFPGYWEIDARRFPPLQELTWLLESCGFAGVTVTKHSYDIRFESVDEVVRVVEGKPFTAFANYVDEEFAEYLRQFEARLRERFGGGEIAYQSNVTLLSMTRASV